MALAVSLLAPPVFSLGLGKVWDQFRPRDSSHAGRAWLGGGEIAVILLLVVAGIALSFQTASVVHDVQAIDRQGSEPVRAHIQMPAGELKVSGGATKLMEADFNYDEAEGKPETSYHVLGGTGNSMSLSRGKNSTSAPPTTNGAFVWRTRFPCSSRLTWALATAI